MNTQHQIWTGEERKLLEKLHTPWKIQEFIDSLPYDPEGGYRSPRYVIREWKAQCFSGALFATAALRFHGFRPMIIHLNADNDDDHILAVFKQRGCWGAIAQSNFTTLRYREPVYRTLRELAMSYFDFYFNTAGEKTLRSYSRPLNLERFDRHEWMTSEKRSHPIEDAIDRLPHYPLVTANMAQQLALVDKKLLAAGLLGSNPDGLYKPKKK